MTPRMRAALLGLTGVLGLQALLVGARGARDPSPFRTFHEFDVTLALTAKVMRGEAWASSLPVAELVPNTRPGFGPPQMWAAVPGNSARTKKMYKKEQPLFFLLAGAIPAALGLGPVTLRLGPMALLGLLAGALGAAGHRLAGVPGMVAAALLMVLVPAGWQAAMMALPGLGMMLAAGVVLWLVLVSDRLRKLPWAPVVGAALGASSWMGESAGDTVQVLAVTLPTVVVGGLWGVADRGSGADRLRALAGLGVAVLVARQMIDVPWILRHTNGYLLSEASGGGRPPDLLSFLQSVPLVLARNLVNGYLETVAWSLLAPAGAALVAGGVLLGLLSKRWLAVLWAMSGSVALLVLLSMPEKTGDYYALAAVPGLVLAAAVGLGSTRRLGLAALGAGGLSLMVVFGTVVHLDLPATRRAICTPQGGTWLLQDPLACSHADPHPHVRPTLRIARELPGSPETRRTAVSQWLAGFQMAEVWAKMAPGSTVWVLGGTQSPTDTALVVALTTRSDILVHQLPTQSHYWQARPSLEGTEDWVFLLGTVQAGKTEPPRWPAWLGAIEDFGGTGDIRVGRLK